MGMSIDDFCRLTPGRFSMAYEEYLNTVSTAFKQSWNRTRFLAAVLLQPHSKKALRPEDICRFEWENDLPGTDLSDDEIELTRRRLEQLEKRWG